MLTALSMGFQLKAQENTHFSQGIFNQAYVNPAYAGSAGNLFQATGAMRMEMVGFEGSPTTSILTVHGGIGAIHGGIGISIFNDKLGYYSMPGVSFSYAFRFKLWDGNFALGLSAGLVNSSINGTQWKYPDGSGSSDPAIPTQDESGVNPDFGIGAYYDNGDFFAGISCMHLTGTKITKTDKQSRLPQVAHAIAGYNFMLSDPRFQIRPYVYASTDFAISHYSLGAHVFYQNKLWGGLSYRWNEAVVGNVGFEIFGGVKIGYAYDFTITRARQGSKGAHEIVLNYNFTLATEKRKQQYRSVRYL